MNDLRERIAGAPITWGVDGSPGWGHLMDRERVMAEMVEVGLSATEIGPDGYLPIDQAELRDILAPYDLKIVGGFVPAVLYRDDLFERDLPYVERAAAQLAGAGSEVLVLGPSSHFDGYDTPIDMDAAQWAAFLKNLVRLQQVVSDNGVRTGLHPHWGMAVDGMDDVSRLLEASDVEICLDTGHLHLAGADPVEVARLAAGRVNHVHLKDLDDSRGAQVRSGEVAFRQATIDGMFTPLGAGDVDIAGVIRTLEAAGFDGWYVIEQDVSLTAEPAPGEGPYADAEQSVRFLHELADTL